MPEFNDAFWRWFGQSKVVDSAGRPLAMYHTGLFDETEDPVAVVGAEGFHFGTKNAAEERDAGKRVDDFIREMTVEQDDDNGRWYWSSEGVDSYDVAGEEGFATKEGARRNGEQFASDQDFSGSEPFPLTVAYLSIQNPKRVRDQKASWVVAVAAAKVQGYDGIVYRNEFEDKGKDSWIAFYPKQIKSATGNDGSWDADDPDITSNPGGAYEIHYSYRNTVTGEENSDRYGWGPGSKAEAERIIHRLETPGQSELDPEEVKFYSFWLERADPGIMSNPGYTGNPGAEYPLADRSVWYGDADFRERGGSLVWISPEEFLAQVRPLKIDESSRDNIDTLKRHILAGGELDPLMINRLPGARTREDGRHRAVASIELGITQVPVILFGAVTHTGKLGNPWIDDDEPVEGEYVVGELHWNTPMPLKSKALVLRDGSLVWWLTKPGPDGAEPHHGTVEDRLKAEGLPVSEYQQPDGPKNVVASMTSGSQRFWITLLEIDPPLCAARELLRWFKGLKMNSEVIVSTDREDGEFDGTVSDFAKECEYLKSRGVG